MKIIQRIMSVGAVTFGLLLMGLPSQAATTTALTLTPTTGDTVQVSVNADVTSQIKLSFLPPGAATLTTIVLGTTDANGKFSTSLSSGGYGIPSGSPVFVRVSGVQSSMILWPTYTSSLTLNKTSVQVAVGQSVAISGSATLILAANSETTIITTSVSGSQVTITGASSGSGTVTVCAMNLGCSSIAVEVGAQTGQTQIAFSPENPVLTVGQSSTVVVLGGGTSGYSISKNSNVSVVDPSFGGGHRALYLYAVAAGSSTITVCSLESSSNCSNLVVTVLDIANKALTFTPNNITLVPGLTQSSTVSGGLDNNYYISSNTNSGIAQATVSSNTVTVVGGSTAGSTTITVCSATTNNRCGNLTVTLNNASTNASSTTIAFSQNVVSVASGETTTVTVTGGNNSGYAVSLNSNPSVVTASVNGSSNVVNLTGNAIGTAIVSICSTSAGTTCASLYVTVSSSLPTIVLSPTTTTLTPGAKTLVSVSGGSFTTTVNSNTNPNAVSVTLSGNGTGLILTGGTTAGTAVITVCPTDTVTSKCTTVTATNTLPSPLTTVKPVTASTTPKPVVASGTKPSSTLTVKITGTAMLNVRASNNAKSKAVATVKKDQVFTVLEEKGGWYRIQASTKVTGWISATYTVKQ